MMSAPPARNSGRYRALLGSSNRALRVWRTPVLRTMQHCRGAGEAAAAALEPEQGLRELGHCHGGIAAVEHNEIGGMASRNAVIGGVHEPRRQACHHVEARGQ